MEERKNVRYGRHHVTVELSSTWTGPLQRKHQLDKGWFREIIEERPSLPHVYMNHVMNVSYNIIVCFWFCQLVSSNLSTQQWFIFME